MDFVREHQRQIVIIGGILVVSLIIWAILYAIFFLQIRSVTPDQGRMSYLTRTITLEFNRTVTSIDSIELVDGTAFTIDDNVVTINVPNEAFQPNREYELVIVSAKSDLGQTIDRLAVMLSPRTGDGLLSDEDRDKILNSQQEEKDDTVNDTIFTYLPYETLDYSISAVVSNSGTEFESVLIEISVFISSVDSADRAGAVSRYEAAARAYLSGLEGITLDDYPITVKVVDLS